MRDDGAQWIVVETYFQPPKSGHKGGIRCRPMPGQDFPTDLNVECSKTERDKHPLGTQLKMRVRLASRAGGKPFLIADVRSNYEVVGSGPV